MHKNVSPFCSDLHILEAQILYIYVALSLGVFTRFGYLMPKGQNLPHPVVTIGKERNCPEHRASMCLGYMSK